MRLSKYFIPTLKENPVDAKIASHRLMIRSGMIRQTNSGIYTFLPLGLKILQKISDIIRKNMEEISCNEILMPIIQPKELWLESERYDSYGKEMLRMQDRHKRDMIFGPTHEEIVTDIFRKNITSYKDLPKSFYQIQTKFRDEIRPRFGVMRAREFMMKDAYSFDLNSQDAKKTYNEFYKIYFRIFKQLGLNAIAVRADTGAIGGDLSHEFHILAKTGESIIYYDKKFDQLKDEINHNNIDELQNLFSAADDMYDEKNCPIDKKDIRSHRSIEVGHIFNFGDKYSKSMKAKVTNKEGRDVHPLMGSYGIGVSRLIATIIEANNDESGIIWPEEISPFDIYLVNLNPDNTECNKVCEKLYHNLKKTKEILYDDNFLSIKHKLDNANLIGIPKQIIIGPKSVKQGYCEVKNRKTGQKENVAIDQIYNF
jgi:prolyl-tRNA synthetase